MPTLLTSPSRPPSACTAPADGGRAALAVARSAAMPRRRSGRRLLGLRESDRHPRTLADQQLGGGQADTGAATGHQHAQIARPSPSHRHHMMAAMTELLVARHGETDWNREGRWQGHGGPGLNEHGRDRREALAKRLQPPLDALYASDLAERGQTAAISRGDRPAAGARARAARGRQRRLARPHPRPGARAEPRGYRRWLDGDSGWSGGETYDDMHARVVATLAAAAGGAPARAASWSCPTAAPCARSSRMRSGCRGTTAGTSTAPATAA